MLSAAGILPSAVGVSIIDNVAALLDVMSPYEITYTCMHVVNHVVLSMR